MDCLKFEKLIYDYLEDRLDSETKNDVKDHFLSCDACYNKYYDDMMLKLGLECFDDKELPYNFHEETADIIYSYKERGKKKTAVLSLVACACAALIIISGISLTGIYKNNNNFSQGARALLSMDETADGGSEEQKEEASEVIYDESFVEEGADTADESEALPEADVSSENIKESTDSADTDKNMIGIKPARYAAPVMPKEVTVSDKDVFDGLKTKIIESGINISENGNIFSFVCDDEELVNDILKSYSLDASVFVGEVIDIVLL